MTPELQHERDTAVVKAKDVLTFRVTDQQSYEVAGRWCKAVKDWHRELDGERTKITKPMLEAKRAADVFFRPALDALLDCESHLKREMAEHVRRVEADRVRIAQASALAVQRDETPTEIIPAPAATPGVSVRHVWSFEIVNPDAVPRELCSPDPAKIKQAIWYADTPHTPPQEIPGVRFFLDGRVTVR